MAPAEEKTAAESYDVSTFQVLADEMPGDDPRSAEKKIKRLLARRRLGMYDQARIDGLRALRGELAAEIKKAGASKYHLGFDRPITEHFDDARMAEDFGRRYPLVRRPDIGGVIGYALYYYYYR